ncbi:hypothetical protein QTP70_004087 [Hemibagrus guttatus]|uniref:ribonuclease H n=1 Tax=Hemibagrus guttatus TaxID=175788 RepID=A0AAE0UTD9_9TELE|nr:hypothetical protein QTP70_004087 [Hemibagrus guttatus]
MPYGLTNAPALFQAFINEIFKYLLGSYVITYIDDILIYSATYKDHICHVTTVLTRLLHNQLYVKAEKCEFHMDSIMFLGNVISKKGVEMDSSKVKAGFRLARSDFNQGVTLIPGVRKLLSISSLDPGMVLSDKVIKEKDDTN